MEMPSATNCFQTFASPFSRQRGRAPGALSHMVSANLRARALAPTIREIWAAGYMSYNAVSRELNRRQVPTLRGGKKWYPMTAGRLLMRLERTELIRIRRQSACSLLELASRESRSNQRRCDRSLNGVKEVGWQALLLEYSYDPIAVSFALGRGGGLLGRQHGSQIARGSCVSWKCGLDGCALDRDFVVAVHIPI